MNDIVRVVRHRGRDYAESVRQRTSRERRAKLKAGIINTLAALAVIIVFYGALEIQRVAESAVARMEQESERESELVAWHTVGVADAQACARERVVQ